MNTQIVINYQETTVTKRIELHVAFDVTGSCHSKYCLYGNYYIHQAKFPSVGAKNESSWHALLSVWNTCRSPFSSTVERAALSCSDNHDRSLILMVYRLTQLNLTRRKIPKHNTSLSANPLNFHLTGIGSVRPSRHFY
jgi:hypothetical protein